MSYIFTVAQLRQRIWSLNVLWLRTARPGGRKLLAPTFSHKSKNKGERKSTKPNLGYIFRGLKVCVLFYFLPLLQRKIFLIAKGIDLHSKFCKCVTEGTTPPSPRRPGSHKQTIDLNPATQLCKCFNLYHTILCRIFFGKHKNQL